MDCKKWSKTYFPCQRAKTGCHTCALLGEFITTGHFSHLHVDIVGPLPPSLDMTYIITIIDRQIRWPKTVPTSSLQRTLLLLSYSIGLCDLEHLSV